MKTTTNLRQTCHAAFVARCLLIIGLVGAAADVNAAAALPNASKLWPGGVVPYVFDSNITPANRDAMRSAMDGWEEAVANVHFVDHVGPIEQPNWIHVVEWGFNHSSVGRSSVPGWQYVSIASWDNQVAIMHELGHALGFWHEQSRPDRDTYVQIEWDKVDPIFLGLNFNFDIASEANTYAPYDFASIMHYDACAYSDPECGTCRRTDPACRTITVRPPWDTGWQERIGRSESLSYWDGLVMSFLYPESNWRFVNPGDSSGGIGTFHEPFGRFSTGIAAVPSGGTLWLLHPGTYTAPATITKSVTLRAPLGGAVLRM